MLHVPHPPWSYLPSRVCCRCWLLEEGHMVPGTMFLEEKNISDGAMWPGARPSPLRTSPADWCSCLRRGAGTAEHLAHYPLDSVAGPAGSLTARMRDSALPSQSLASRHQANQVRYTPDPSPREMRALAVCSTGTHCPQPAKPTCPRASPQDSTLANSSKDELESIR